MHPFFINNTTRIYYSQFLNIRPCHSISLPRRKLHFSTSSVTGASPIHVKDFHLVVKSILLLLHPTYGTQSSSVHYHDPVKRLQTSRRIDQQNICYTSHVSTTLPATRKSATTRQHHVYVFKNDLLEEIARGRDDNKRNVCTRSIRFRILHSRLFYLRFFTFTASRFYYLFFYKKISIISLQKLISEIVCKRRISRNCFVTWKVPRLWVVSFLNRKLQERRFF